MVQVNWDDVPNADDYSPLPDGVYECEVNNCVERQTQAGDVQFGLEFVVITGTAKGRKIFDNILFKFDSENAMKRTKLVVSRLGIPVEGVGKVEAADLIGRKVFVTVAGIEEYKDKTGKVRQRNTIPFNGYRHHDQQEDNGLPF